MNKLNEKGQSLALFVIFLPVIMMIGTLVIDIGLANYNKHKLDEISKSVLDYGLNNIDNDPYSNMVDLIYQNDSDIDSYEIDMDLDNRKIKLVIKKATKGVFGSIIGKEIYKEESSYVGYFKEENIVIERDD